MHAFSWGPFPIFSRNDAFHPAIDGECNHPRSFLIQASFNVLFFPLALDFSSRALAGAQKFDMTHFVPALSSFCFQMDFFFFFSPYFVMETHGFPPPTQKKCHLAPRGARGLFDLFFLTPPLLAFFLPTLDKLGQSLSRLPSLPLRDVRWTSFKSVRPEADLFQFFPANFFCFSGFFHVSPFSFFF